jgi:hypothetical protein
VHAEDFVVNKSGDWHAIENILEFFPQSNTIPVFALVIKPIYPIDLSTLVVASKQEEVFLKLNFVCEKKDNCLN